MINFGGVSLTGKNENQYIKNNNQCIDRVYYCDNNGCNLVYLKNSYIDIDVYCYTRTCGIESSFPYKINKSAIASIWPINSGDFVSVSNLNFDQNLCLYIKPLSNMGYFIKDTECGPSLNYGIFSGECEEDNIDDIASHIGDYYCYYVHTNENPYYYWYDTNDVGISGVNGYYFYVNDALKIKIKNFPYDINNAGYGISLIDNQELFGIKASLDFNCYIGYDCDGHLTCSYPFLIKHKKSDTAKQIKYASRIVSSESYNFIHCCDYEFYPSGQYRYYIGPGYTTNGITISGTFCDSSKLLKRAIVYAMYGRCCYHKTTFNIYMPLEFDIINKDTGEYMFESDLFYGISQSMLEWNSHGYLYERDRFSTEI